MSALDDLFDEVEHHAVLRSHATLTRDARNELSKLREQAEIDERMFNNCSAQHSQLRAEIETWKTAERLALETVAKLQAELDAKDSKITALDNQIFSIERKLAESYTALDEAKQKLHDAISLAEEGIGYTSPYFVNKWNMQSQCDELKDWLSKHKAGDK